MAGVLDAMRATAVYPTDHLSCDSSGGTKKTAEGSYVVPYCTVNATAPPASSHNPQPGEGADQL